MQSSVLGELRYGQPFRDMNEDDLVWLDSRLKRRCFTAGELVIDAGVPASRLFFIARGNVLLETDPDNRIVAELVTGECFPLETLISGSAVQLRFRANQELLCEELSEEDLQMLSRRSDVFRKFCLRLIDSIHSHEFNRSITVYTQLQSLEDDFGRPLSATDYVPPLTIESDATCGRMLSEMHKQEGRTCLIVNSLHEMVGSFGLHDLLERVIRQPIDSDLRVSAVMALPIPALPLDAPAYAAAALMAERGCHEIALLDNGKVAGIIDEQHLFELSNLSAADLSRRLRTADTVEEWIKVSGNITHYTRHLIGQGFAAARVTRLVSELTDKLTVNIITKEFSQLQLPEGTRWAWLVFGSEGRHEQTLLTDQDNGLVFSLPEKSNLEAVRQAFIHASKAINETLAECGYPLCKGLIMASNPDCCLSQDEWLQKFYNWIANPDPEAILNATIFFDFRFLTGHRELVAAMQTGLAAMVPENHLFPLLFAESAMQRAPPIGFFRDFQTDNDGMIDLKLGAVTIFVDAARLYALINGVIECATDKRFDRLSALGKLDKNTTIAWQNAFSFVQTLRLRSQNESLTAGRMASNRLNPYELNELDRRFLLESLRQAAKLQKRVQMDFSQHQP